MKYSFQKWILEISYEQNHITPSSLPPAKFSGNSHKFDKFLCKLAARRVYNILNPPSFTKLLRNRSDLNSNLHPTPAELIRSQENQMMMRHQHTYTLPRVATY